MKSFYYILLFLGVPLWLSAQSSTQNYIVGTVPYQAVTNPTTLTDANSNTNIQYFDGLGRPSQTVQRAITPTSADLVSGIKYDNFGRDYQHWLPGSVSGNSGAYVSDFATPAASTNGDANPYATIEYDGSPLNRVTGQYGAGAAWYAIPGKKKIVNYTTNGSDVKYFYVEGTQLKCTTNYTSSTLYGQKTTDEDGKTVEEFTDKQGRKVLSRLAGNHDTYFVYDDLDNLRYVLPPMAADALGISSGAFDEGAGSTLYNYGYIYHYDGRKRCIDKKLPGCEPILMVYDLADRLVLSQDGNQRVNSQWIFAKYDPLGRIILTGKYTDARALADIRAQFGSLLVVEEYKTQNNYSYTWNVPPIVPPADVLKINYYDSRSRLTDGSSSFAPLIFSQLTGYDNQYTNTTNASISEKGLLTGIRTKLLDGSGEILSAYYYDDKGYAVQTRTRNHLLGYDIVSNNLNFGGKPIKTYKTHGINGASATYTELYSYFYNKAQQVLGIAHQLNGGTTVILASNTYDELGRLSTKTTGGINAITHSDVTAYTYNVRNWTTGITGSNFTENLYYNANTANLPVFTPCYNGNIAGMQWSVPGESLGYNRAYTFGYDGLNRLTDANYCGFNGSAVAGTTGKYDEHMGFNKMGNFNTLTRNENGTPINNLTFSYIGNQMSKVDNSVSPKPFIPYGSEAFKDSLNAGTEYTYDKNGSTTSDLNTGVSTIQYNLLNLPDQIQFIPGHKNLYTYDASGTKLKVINYSVRDIINVPIGTISTLPDPSRYTKLTTDYVGNMIYENGSLKEILLPEGYWQNGVYYYYLKDHLGDTRVVINNSGTVIEKSHYYPSGMRFYPESSSNGSALPYRYNGKELEAMNGLNQYDYGARRRGAGLPVFTTVDPLAEKYYSISPYAYCGGDPVNRIDIMGDSITVTQEALETILYGLKDGTNLHINVNNGMIDPESIKDQAENSDDLFLQDLYEIACNEQVVEMSVGPSYKYNDNNGKTLDSNEDYHATPADQPETSPLPFRSIYDDRENDGSWIISGNTGRTLVPGSDNLTGANSTNNHVQVIVNSNGTNKQRAVGAAHEFGHVVLYLRSGGKSYTHIHKGVNIEIGKRVRQMINKLYK